MNDVSSDSQNLHSFERKKKREKQEIRISEIESIAWALRTFSENVARET